MHILLIPILLLSLAILSYLFTILWLYKDCKRLQISPIFWICLMIVTTPIVGTIIYLIYRRKTQGSYVSNASKTELWKVGISYAMLCICCIGMAFYFYVNTYDTWPFASAFAEYEYKVGNTLDYRFQIASKEYEKQFTFNIEDTSSQDLYYDVNMDKGTIILVIEQNGVNKEVVIKDNEDSVLDLEDMKTGKLYITVVSKKAVNLDVNIDIK